MKQFLMGNQILAQAAKDAGAKMMFGYPITPSTEILETWAKFCLKDKSLKILQTEDEMAAGFGVIGSCLAGVPAFTATAGPGNILMQDAIVMAEALRIPMVGLIIQRGGMSTSTVIYSQEEVRLTCFGGNSEGFRIVYSTSNLQELYDYTLKAFQMAWKYRWPTFVLADGYQGKMKGEVEFPNSKTPLNNLKPILNKGVNLRNCYNLEEEIAEKIANYNDEYQKTRGEIEEYEEYQTQDAKIILVAHGIVAAATRMAVDKLRKKRLSIGLFRPITLRPFPVQAAAGVLGKAQKIIVLESALGQLAELFKSELFGLNTTLIEVNKPALGFTPEEITKTVLKLKK
jgi:2-oxoglutarate ferredoxin oxidoreductase subunit alpha